MIIKERIRDISFLSIVLGTVVWFFLALLLKNSIPSELFNFTPWLVIIGIDIFFIVIMLGRFPQKTRKLVI